MKVLSIVCARAGSKGVPNKCIHRVADKMIVEYSIEYSLSLGPNVKTVVSTDIEELIEYCTNNGVVCMRRSPTMAEDGSRIDGVIHEAIVEHGDDADLCNLVYGNIPTRYPELFHECLKYVQDETGYDASITMQNVEKYHPEWMFDLNEDVIPEARASGYRRQMLPQKMIHDGHTLLFRTKDFCDRYNGKLTYEQENQYSIFGKRIRPVINSRIIVDIDTPRDLQLAEAVIRYG